MGVDRKGQPDQSCRIFLRIVDATRKGILKGDPPPGLFKIIPAGIHQFRNAVLLRDRHQFPPFFICRAVQRKGQRDLQVFLRQLLYLRHKPAGGNRDISLADMKPLFVRQHSDKTDQIFHVIERLPDPHNHHIGNPIPGLSGHRIDLLQHFRRRQAPLKPAQCGSAEFAAHFTAYLRGNADGIAVVISHQNTLHHIAIRQLK